MYYGSYICTLCLCSLQSGTQKVHRATTCIAEMHDLPTLAQDMLTFKTAGFTTVLGRPKMQECFP